jgi:hypothetical protein
MLMVYHSMLTGGDESSPHMVANYRSAFVPFLKELLSLRTTR